MGKSVNVAVATVAAGMALASTAAHAQQGISPRQGEGLLSDLVRRGVPPQEAREGLEALAAAVPSGQGRVSRLPSGLTLRVIVDGSRLTGLQGCRVASVNFVQAPANASYSAVWCPRPDGLEAQQGSGDGMVKVQTAAASPPLAPAVGRPQRIQPRQVDDLLADMGRRGVSVPDADTAIVALGGDLARGANGSRIVQGPSGMPITVEVVQGSVPAMADCPTGRVAFADRAWFTATFCPRPAGWTIQDGRVSPLGTMAYPMADQVDEARLMRVRAPLLEQPNPASRNLGNLIENSRVRMTGHLSAMPGWVRIEVLGKVGYTQESNLFPLQQEQQARASVPGQPSSPIPPAVAAAPEAVPVPAPRQAAAPVVPVPATPQPAQAAPLIAGPAAPQWAREATGEVPRQPAPPPPPPVQAAQQPPAPPRAAEAPQQPVPAPAPVVAAPAAPVVPAPMVTATPAVPAQRPPQQPPAPVAQAVPTPAPAPAPPARKPVDSSL